MKIFSGIWHSLAHRESLRSEGLLSEESRWETQPRCQLLCAVLFGSVLFALLQVTTLSLPMTWDEGNAILRAEGIGRGQWRYTTVVEGHPAFYGIVIHAGRSISAAWLSPLASYRFGPIVLFTIAAGAMFYRMSQDYGMASGIGAVGALVLLPRLFAHAQLAHCDGTLTACWMLSWVGFAPARRHWGWAFVWGIALGMTLSTKATGWIAPIPFVVWSIVYFDRGGFKALALGLPVAIGMFCLLNPPLWNDPITGLVTFIQMNFNREPFNISTQFLGRMYNLDYPLPWYNTLFWVMVTVPVGLLGLLFFGLVVVCREWRVRPLGTLLLAEAVVLLVVRSLPFSPPHDGVRLFVPSFAFLAAVIGVAVGTLLRRDAWRSFRQRTIAASLVGLIYIGSATSLLWYAPHWLSYYNLTLGGLPGATSMGMEPTYYWDGLDASVLEWLAKNTQEDEKVYFASPSGENLLLMQRWGTLEVEYRPDAPGRYRWYVLQHRPSGMRPVDHWLIDHYAPVFRKTIRSGGWGPWRLDTPILEVYHYDDCLRASRSSHLDVLP